MQGFTHQSVKEISMRMRVAVFTVVFFSFMLCVVLNVFSQSYESLTPLLIDLGGWSAESPEGMDLNYGGTKAITATREYSQRDKSISAAIMVGQQMQGTWNPVYQEGFRMESSEGSMAVERIRGFLVFHSFDKTESEGAIVILLQEASPDGSGGAVFLFGFDGLSKDEAMKLAQKFDWDAMKNRVSKR
jgi:hypothetical protein